MKKIVKSTQTTRKSRKDTSTIEDVSVDWKAECIELLKRVYPGRWKEELYRIQVKYLARQKGYKP